MKLLDMEIGKVYESEAYLWRRTKEGIQRKCKDGTVWGGVVLDIDVTEVTKPHEWTPDELAVFRLVPVEYTWIAKDSNGDTYAYEEEPCLEDGDYFGGRMGGLDAINFPSINPGEKYPIPREEEK